MKCKEEEEEIVVRKKYSISYVTSVILNPFMYSFGDAFLAGEVAI